MNHNYIINTIYSLLFLLLLTIVVAFFILPFFTIKEIKLDSSISFNSSVEKIAGLDRYSSYLFLDTKSIESRIEGEPLVRKVFVEKLFPNTLNITVFGRKALAISYAESNGVSIPVCFDENGVVFQIGDDIEDINLPIICGDVDFNNISMGGELPKVLVPLLKSLKDIRGSIPEYYSSISEIKVNKKGSMTFDLTLHFTFTPIKAVVKDSLTAEELKNIIVVISLLEKESVNVDFVDFREDEIVYREKE